MDLGTHHFPQCQFEGCNSIVLSEGPYCITHKKVAGSKVNAVPTTTISPVQNTSRPAGDPLAHSSSQQPASLPFEHDEKTDPSRQKLGDAVMVKPTIPATSPVNPKKQLPDKHVARKTTKATHHQGSSHEPVSPSSNRISAAEVSVSPQRPAKKPKLSIELNRPEPQRLNTPAIVDNRFHVSPENARRYSEERHNGLESAEDFALRPKKISLDESSKAKRHVDHGSALNRERAHKSPPRNSYAPSNNVGKPRFLENVGDSPLIIDLTGDDVGTHPSSGRSHPSPARRGPINHHTARRGPLNGYNNAPGSVSVPGPREDRTREELRTNHRVKSPPLGNFGCLTKRKEQEGPPTDKHKPGLAISPSNGSRHTQGDIKSVVPPSQLGPSPELNCGRRESIPTVNENYRREIISNGLPNSDSKLVESQKNGTHAEKKVQSPLLNPPCRQLMNGNHTFATFEKSLTPPPVQPRIATNEIDTEPGLGRSSKTNGIHKEHARPHTPAANPSVEALPNGSSPGLSSMFQPQQRSWKHLSPEERRQAWIAKHDPNKFDSYIYGEPNRLNRPGHPLYYLPEYARPAWPRRPATRFAHIDPRVHWTHARSEQWHRDKRDEIAARGTRKANFGRVAERRAAAAAAAGRDKQASDGGGGDAGSLPGRVRDNPKWLAALDELDEMAAEYHERKRAAARRKGKGKDIGKGKGKGKEKASGGDDAMDVDMDMDMDMDMDVDMDTGTGFGEDK